MNAVNNRTCTKYNKADSEGQGQIFEEITGKSNADDVFTKITKDFGGKFPCFFVKKMTHNDLLSLKSVGESSVGEATASGTGLKLFSALTFGENVRFNYR